MFEKLLEYIYYGQIKTKTFEDLSTVSVEKKYVMLLVNVYVDADKYCMEACQNHVMDFFFQCYWKRYPMPCTIVELGKRGLRACNLRKFLIESLRRRTYSPDRLLKNLKVDREIMQLITAGGNDAEDFFNACVQRSTEQNCSNVPGMECNWHTHTTTERCINGIKGNVQ